MSIVLSTTAIDKIIIIKHSNSRLTSTSFSQNESSPTGTAFLMKMGRPRLEQPTSITFPSTGMAPDQNNLFLHTISTYFRVRRLRQMVMPVKDGYSTRTSHSRQLPASCLTGGMADPSRQHLVSCRHTKENLPLILLKSNPHSVFSIVKSHISLYLIILGWLVKLYWHQQPSDNTVKCRLHNPMPDFTPLTFKNTQKHYTRLLIIFGTKRMERPSNTVYVSSLT